MTGNLCETKLMHDIDMSRGSWIVVTVVALHTEVERDASSRYMLQAVLAGCHDWEDERRSRV